MLSWELLFFQTVTEFYFVLYESKLYREPFQGRAMLIFSKIPKKENKKSVSLETFLLAISFNPQQKSFAVCSKHLHFSLLELTVKSFY